jgi:hypothetical protein
MYAHLSDPTLVWSAISLCVAIPDQRQMVHMLYYVLNLDKQSIDNPAC